MHERNLSPVIDSNSGFVVDSVSYMGNNGRCILDKCSLKVPTGEILGILGPSGAGKTTFFRVISGLLKPNSGSIEFDRLNFVCAPINRRPISYLQQGFPLYRNLTVFENVMVAFEASTLSKKLSKERVFEMLNAVGLGSDICGRYPCCLSGGEAQRVALAKALLKPCRILLLDEPLSNVDKSRKSELSAIIRNVILRENIAALYISHDETELLLSSDRIAVMNLGRLVQVGTYAEIHESPISSIVAAIGSSVGIQRISRRELEAHRFSASGVKVSSNSWEFVGWHPESGEILREPTEGTRLILEGIVERIVEIQNSLYICISRIIDDRERLFWHVTANAKTTFENFLVGDKVYLSIPSPKLIYMDKDGTFVDVLTCKQNTGSVL